MKRLILFTIVISVYSLLYTFSACAEEPRKEDISCKQAWELIQKHKADTNFVIVDFRPKEIFDEAHIEDAIYFDVFDKGIDEWLKGLDKNRTYLIYCTIGFRSGIGLEKMKKLGFKNIYHMYQGLERWQEEGYKTLAAPLENQK